MKERLFLCDWCSVTSYNSRVFLWVGHNNVAVEIECCVIIVDCLKRQSLDTRWCCPLCPLHTESHSLWQWPREKPRVPWYSGTWATPGVSSRTPGLRRKGPGGPEAPWRNGSSRSREEIRRQKCSPLHFHHCPLALCRGVIMIGACDNRQGKRVYLISMQILWWALHIHNTVCDSRLNYLTNYSMFAHQKTM